MKPNEFLERLQSITELSIITLAPGPLKIRVGHRDAMAARLILWLEQEVPDDTTVDEFLGVLAAAAWWITFWSSLEKESDTDASEDEHDADTVKGNHPT